MGDAPQTQEMVQLGRDPLEQQQVPCHPSHLGSAVEDFASAFCTGSTFTTARLMQVLGCGRSKSPVQTLQCLAALWVIHAPPVKTYWRLKKSSFSFACKVTQFYIVIFRPYTNLLQK